MARLETALSRAPADPDVKAKLNKLLFEASHLPSAELGKLQAQELQQWFPVVRDSGFKPK